MNFFFFSSCFLLFIAFSTHHVFLFLFMYLMNFRASDVLDHDQPIWNYTYIINFYQYVSRVNEKNNKKKKNLKHGLDEFTKITLDIIFTLHERAKCKRKEKSVKAGILRAKLLREGQNINGLTKHK